MIKLIKILYCFVKYLKILNINMYQSCMLWVNGNSLYLIYYNPIKILENSGLLFIYSWSNGFVTRIRLFCFCILSIFYLLYYLIFAASCTKLARIPGFAVKLFVHVRSGWQQSLEVVMELINSLFSYPFVISGSNIYSSCTSFFFTCY